MPYDFHDVAGRPFVSANPDIFHLLGFSLAANTFKPSAYTSPLDFYIQKTSTQRLSPVCTKYPMANAYSSEAPILDTYQAVVSAYSDFLTVAIHTILYERGIYPQASFLKARKYNFPVRQSRHPKVCKWIQDAVAAVEREMMKVGTNFRVISIFLLRLPSTKHFCYGILEVFCSNQKLGF